MAPLKQYLLIPGPTPVPERVLQAMHRPMINHRGPDFGPMYHEIHEGLQWSFQTKQEVYILPASGTGGMEAAIVNVLSPGDKVLILNIGAFGSRFVKIARAYGLTVEEIKFERGKAVDLAMLDKALAADTKKEIKAVLFQQNETSTGVLNNVAAIAKRVSQHGALSVVDAVSGLLAADLQTDAWGLDVVVSGSQKAFMLPPGLSMITMSAKAWKAYEAAKLPKFYWDLGQWRKFLEKWSTPVTPALSLIYGLQESLKMLRAEGLPAIFKRHETLALATRAGVRALRAECLSGDDVASHSLTPVIPPAGVDAEVVRKRMREEFGFTLAGGQEELKGKIFRIGHLGYVDSVEILGALRALGRIFRSLGVDLNEEAGVKAAEEVLA